MAIASAGTSPSGLEVADFIVGLIGSIGTIAALVVAIYLGVHEVRKIREDADRREAEQREREDEKRREQAEQISAIARVQAEPRREYDLGRIAGGVPRPARYFGWADIINASTLPIYEAKVAMPSEREDGMWAVISVGFVPPGENGHAHLPPLDDRTLHGQPVVVAFRDAGGRWWSRCEEGHIHEH